MIEVVRDKSHFTIVLADDSKASLGRISGFLKEEGYIVKEAGDGEEALNFLKPTPPDLIILDDFMPNLNGYKACAKIKENSETRLIPIIIISTMREQSDRIKTMKAGADDYLTRPVDKLELSLRVNNLLTLKMLRSESTLSQRFAALGRLAGGVAHEINNPLTGVVTNLEMVKNMKGKLDENELLVICERNNIEGDALKDIKKFFITLKEREEKKRKMIELAVKGGRRCSKIVGELLSYSSANRKWTPSKVKIKEIIQRSLSLTKSQFKETEAKIDFESSHGDVEVLGHKWELQQVFMSLLANAFKAIEKSSEKRISISINKERTYALIKVRDSGCGIPKKDMESIFDYFYTTRDEGEGFGLGLSTVYEIVLKHNGLIDVASEVGKGTEFRIRLPLFSVYT